MLLSGSVPWYRWAQSITILEKNMVLLLAFSVSCTSKLLIYIYQHKYCFYFYYIFSSFLTTKNEFLKCWSASSFSIWSTFLADSTQRDSALSKLLRVWMMNVLGSQHSVCFWRLSWPWCRLFGTSFLLKGDTSWAPVVHTPGKRIDSGLFFPNWK